MTRRRPPPEDDPHRDRPAGFYRVFTPGPDCPTLEDAIEQATAKAIAAGMTDVAVQRSGIIRGGNFWVELRGHWLPRGATL